MNIFNFFPNTKTDLIRKEDIMKKVLPIVLFIILFLGLFLLSAKSYANTVSKDLANNFFRLHILANSDSKKDQELKLKVRDRIIDYMNNHNFNSKQDAIYYVENNLSELYKIAENTIIDNGYNYSVNIEIGNFYFPTKYYGNISLPAGFYDGIKIEIGNAKGQNWWCSLFPPLCFVDISSGIVENNDLNELEEELSDEEFSLITEQNSDIKFKFKIIELLNKSK